MQVEDALGAVPAQRRRDDRGLGLQLFGGKVDAHLSCLSTWDEQGLRSTARAAYKD
jgi:hypothetical protein